MTPELEMKAIVEAAGECWHELKDHLFQYTAFCHKCGLIMSYKPGRNPSPTDLNELFRLAEKLHIGATLHFDKVVNRIEADVFDGTANHYAKADTPADQYSIKE